MVVMDEAFDMWRDQKNVCDYHLWFEDWWARDISYMVLRDRNHPCVFSYSIGNEIFERDGSSDGAEWAVRLAREVRKYDPTRPVTSAVCCIWNTHPGSDPEEYLRDCAGEGQDPADFSTEPGSRWDECTKGYFAALDICGYNYLHTVYEHHHELYPERVMWGSESKALSIYDIWELVRKHNYVIGDFTWTAFDNLGEAGAGQFRWESEGKVDGLELGRYPWRSCYQGDLDLCGFRRPQSYYRETVWGLRKEPVIFTTHPARRGEGFTGTGWHWYDIHDDWSFGTEYAGQPVRTEVYTDADEVEFRLNGKSLGRAAVERMTAAMDIPYEPGLLEADTFKAGVLTGHAELRTVGPAAKLVIEAERDSLRADGRDLCYLDIAVTDGEGRRIPLSKAALHCEVEGGELLGIFSGDPANEDAYGSPDCHAFEGRAAAVIRAHAPGMVKVRVSSEGLSGCCTEVSAEG